MRSEGVTDLLPDSGPVKMIESDPTSSFEVLLRRSSASPISGRMRGHRVQQREYRVGHIASHHGRRWCAGYSKAQEGELTCHSANSDHGRGASHHALRGNAEHLARADHRAVPPRGDPVAARDAGQPDRDPAAHFPILGALTGALSALVVTTW